MEKPGGPPLFDAVADGRECPHLGRRVDQGRTSSRPSRPCAAAGSAAAAAADPAAPRRGVGRGRVRPVAAVAGIATIAATACGAVRRSARSTMTPYWRCASSHVAAPRRSGAVRGPRCCRRRYARGRWSCAARRAAWRLCRRHVLQNQDYSLETPFSRRGPTTFAERHDVNIVPAMQPEGCGRSRPKM